MNAETPTGPFIRTAIPHDAEGIAKVHVKGWQEAYVGHLPQQVLDRQSVPARLRLWQGLLQEPPSNRWTFVAVDPNAGIVGFVSGVRARPVIFGAAFKVPVLYVLQSHLRQGLGRKLIHALWSLASNLPARKFYEAIGGRLLSVLTEADSNGRVVLAGYRWRSATELADGSADSPAAR